MRAVKLVRQTILTECGVCSLSMVASYYGYNKTISFYRNVFSIGRDGTTIKELYDMFTSIGMAVKVYKCQNLEDFSFQKGLPYIIYCKDNHYVVLQSKGKSFIVSDPAEEQACGSISEVASSFAGIIIEATPTETFQKSTNHISEYRYVKRIICDNIRLILLSLFFAILAYSFAIFVPIYLQRIIDGLASAELLNYTSIISQICGILLLYALFSFVRNRMSVALEVVMSDNVNRGTMLHLLRIPYAFFDNRSSGNILYRLGILEHLRNVIATSFVSAIIEIASTICVFIYITVSFPKLVMPVTAIFALIGFYTLLILRRSIRLQKKELKDNEALSNLKTEIVNNMFQIKCLHLENYFRYNFEQVFATFQDSFAKERNHGSSVSLGYSVINVFAPIFVVLYCYCFMPETVTAGIIVLIYSLLGMFTNSTYILFGRITTLFQIKSVVFYLNDMLDEPELDTDGNKQIAQFETLKVESVTFKYNKKSRIIVKDFNLTVNRGEKIGIVGITGSGKTTIVKLLTGLYEPTEGKLLINGIPLKELERDKLSELVVVVPQIPILFNKNIRDNITLGNPNITDEMIIVALNCACLLEDVSKMPLGLNTYVSGQGGNLSGGQIQRLALARALVRSPQLLIMDEATSSLDAVTENQIYQNLKQLGISTIVISHRLSTVMDSDCLYYIAQGEVDSGKHECLLRNNPAYENLFSQQIGNKCSN